MYFAFTFWFSLIRIKIHIHLQLSAEIWLSAVCIQLYKKTRHVRINATPKSDRKTTTAEEKQ